MVFFRFLNDDDDDDGDDADDDDDDGGDDDDYDLDDPVLGWRAARTALGAALLLAREDEA